MDCFVKAIKIEPCSANGLASISLMVTVLRHGEVLA